MGMAVRHACWNALMLWYRNGALIARAWSNTASW